MIMFSRIANWFAKIINPPRLWTKEEWKGLSSKEKIWIWYKHHWYIKGVGSAEVDNFTNPVKEIILYGSLIILTTERLFSMAGIAIGPTTLLLTVGIIGIILWTANFVIQWCGGNKIDNLDLIALTNEIGDRRKIAFRELRKAAKREEWRK